MNFKVFFLSIFILIWLSNFSYTNAKNDKVIWFYKENILPDFTKENAWDKNDIYYMYLFNDFLIEKNQELLSQTWSDNTKKVETINELLNINKAWINYKLKTFDKNPVIIEEVIKKLEEIDQIEFKANRPERYKKFIDIIKKSWYLNSQNKEWKTLFFQVLKYWDFKLLEFILNRWLDQNIVNNDWNSAAIIFATTWKRFPADLEDKKKAWSLNLEETKKYLNFLIKRWLDLNHINKKWENILFNAVRLGNKEIIELLINAWVNINIKNNEMLSPLMLAISKKSSNEILSLFIENKNFDSTLVDMDWNWYLHKLMKDDTKILKKLLQTNIDINLINTFWETPLITMIKESRNEEDIIIKLDLLLEKENLNLNIQDNLWKSLLLYSIEKSYNKLFSKLLKSWTNPLQIDNEWNSTLILAAQKNNIDIIKELLEIKEININAQNNIWETALHIAFQKWNFWIINLLLDKWIDLDSFNLEKQNILISSIDKSDIKILNWITKYNPDYEVELENWTTPIFLAIKRENTEIIKKLIELWVNINHIDDEWKNPIYKALIIQNINIIKLLLENKVDLSTLEIKNIEDKIDIEQLIETWTWKTTNEEWDITPLLSVACSNNDFNAIKLLLDNKVYINEIDSNWKNCLNYVVNFDSINIWKLLINKWINIDNKDNEEEKTPLLIASWLGYTDYVKLLLEKWADINAVDVNWINSLIIATLNWFTKVWKILINNWIDVNSEDMAGFTSLYYAVKWNNIELVKSILSKWVKKLNIQNPEWDSMLLMAIKNNSIEISNILIKSWADIYEKDLDWKDSIYYCALNNNSEIFKLLLEKDKNLVYNTYEDKTLIDIAKESNNLDILHIIKKYSK